MDVGGSKIATALVSPQGKIVYQESTPTLAEEGVEAVVGRMLASADSVTGKANLSLSCLSGAAIAVAGPVDTGSGVVTASPNLPGWHDVPLREIMEKATGLKTLLINAASAAALGEHCFGAGRGVSNLIYITVSTGIGEGIIIDGKLYGGVSGSAGEVGHMTIDINGPRCNCGNNGCLEVLASGKAVAREARKLVVQGARTRIMELAEGEPANITATIVASAARDGDSLALSVVSKAATYLGIGMVNLVNIFNPEMIVVGGGMAKMGDMLLDPARKVVAERAFHLPASRVSIVCSQLGDTNGMLGAAALALGLAQG
ncbi:MAG: ROK family protein [Chloroflexi bacterium]|nr:ROK family protein [Chloroflexota bacterium]